MSLNSEDMKEPVPSLWVAFFGCYLTALSMTLLYLLVRLWPGHVPLKSDYSGVTLIPGLGEVQVWNETRYLLIVAITGALGGFIHLATSFADYLGNRQFVSSWKWWYILRPFIGSALAMIVYFAARGGLVAGSTGAESLSPYGIAALAGLAGMFSKQGADKLREVFENLFRTEKPPRADPLRAQPPDPLKPAS